MPRKAAPQEPRRGSLDMLMSRASAVRARLGNDENVSVDYIEACGDCFYMSVEAALSEAQGWQPFYSVAAMREVVASRLTEEIFQLYTLLHAQQADGFAWMSGVDSLDALRKRVRLRGQKVGAAKCVWADGFAMETVANHFGLLLLVVDERFSGASKFTRIQPRDVGDVGEAGSSSEGSSSSSELPLERETLTLLLHASEREHMNLIRYSGKKLLNLGDLPLALQKFWGISVAPWPLKVRSPGGGPAAGGPNGSTSSSAATNRTAAGGGGGGGAASASQGRGRGRGRGAGAGAGASAAAPAAAPVAAAEAAATGSRGRGRGGGAGSRGTARRAWLKKDWSQPLSSPARKTRAPPPGALPAVAPRVLERAAQKIAGAPSRRTRSAVLGAALAPSSKRARVA